MIFIQPNTKCKSATVPSDWSAAFSPLCSAHVPRGPQLQTFTIQTPQRWSTSGYRLFFYFFGVVCEMTNYWVEFDPPVSQQDTYWERVPLQLLAHQLLKGVSHSLVESVTDCTFRFVIRWQGDTQNLWTGVALEMRFSLNVYLANSVFYFFMFFSASF